MGRDWKELANGNSCSTLPEANRPLGGGSKTLTSWEMPTSCGSQFLLDEVCLTGFRLRLEEPNEIKKAVPLQKWDEVAVV